MSPLLPSVNGLGAESNPDLGWTVLPVTAMLPRELWENCSRHEVHQTSFLLTNNLSSFLAFVGILMTSTLHRKLTLFSSLDMNTKWQVTQRNKNNLGVK